MTIALLVFLLLILAAAFWRRRGNGVARPGRRRAAARSADAGYRCVSVNAGLNGCRPVQGFRGRRFLPNEAPSLPLPGCDERRCECRFVHHADRRDGDRRDPYSRLGVESRQLPDRRRGRDRRSFA